MRYLPITYILCDDEGQPRVFIQNHGDGHSFKSLIMIRLDPVMSGLMDQVHLQPRWSIHCSRQVWDRNAKTWTGYPDADSAFDSLDQAKEEMEYILKHGLPECGG